MDRHYAYYVDGNLIDIVKEESERNARYFLRVKFITQQVKIDDVMVSRFVLYDPEEVVTYSKIHA